MYDLYVDTHVGMHMFTHALKLTHYTVAILYNALHRLGWHQWRTDYYNMVLRSTSLKQLFVTFVQTLTKLG